MAKVTDPVCGMSIDDAEAPEHAEHDGKTYSFCSRDCREEFEDNPTDYAA